MYGAIMQGCPAFCGHVQVRHPNDIEFLVKEAEVVTGVPGRIFVVAGAERLTYRVRSRTNGYEVERLDPACNASGQAMYLLPEMMIEHGLGRAMRMGCLFTPVLRD